MNKYIGKSSRSVEIVTSLEPETAYPPTSLEMSYSAQTSGWSPKWLQLGLTLDYITDPLVEMPLALTTT